MLISWIDRYEVASSIGVVYGSMMFWIEVGEEWSLTIIRC
jgi:hypothetical protein